MKTAVKTREFESTIEGEVIDLQLDQDSLIHLMNQFIDLYSDKEMAVLREYATNALDAHLAAGTKRPIEVHLPSFDNPTLIVRDYGIGLSHDEIRDIYSKYGASTKRDSNDFTGALGLGCKAALTYTDQFTLVAVKDGLRNVALVSRDSSGAGRIVIAERDAETREPNGVTIQVPAARHNYFAQKAARLFQYWDAGTVLVDDEAPKRFAASEITDGLYLRRSENRYNHDHVVVMGGIAYPFDPKSLGWEVGHDHDVVAFVPLGTVEFTPSREGLRDTKENKAAIFRIGQTLLTQMQKTAQDDIDAAANPAEAIRRAHRWHLDLPEKARPKAWSYKGDDMPIYFEAPKTTEKAEDGTERIISQAKWTVVPEKSGKVSEHSKLPKVPFATAINAIWFYGYDVKFTANHRRRIEQWHVDVRQDVEVPHHYILTSEKPDMTYLKADQVYDWAEVKAIKLPQHRHAENGRLIGSYDVVLPGLSGPRETLASSIDQDEAVFYFVASQRKSKWAKTRETIALPYIQVIRAYEPNASVVLLPETRLRKFLEQFPDAEDIRPAVQEHFDTWAATLTADERKALALHTNSDHDDFVGLDVALIDDPDIREAIRIAQIDIKRVLAQFQGYAEIGNRLTLPEYKNPFEHYPLMPSGYTRRYYTRGGKDKAHWYAYMNAAYRLRLDPAGF